MHLLGGGLGTLIAVRRLREVEVLDRTAQAASHSVAKLRTGERGTLAGKKNVPSDPHDFSGEAIARTEAEIEEARAAVGVQVAKLHEELPSLPT